MSQLSLDYSIALKEEGISRAAENAGGEWRREVVAYLRDWLRPRRGEEIAFEEFRAQAPLAMHPKSTKAWGALPRMAVSAGLVAHTGRYTKARSPRTHAHPVALWRVL